MALRDVRSGRLGAPVDKPVCDVAQREPAIELRQLRETGERAQWPDRQRLRS